MGDLAALTAVSWLGPETDETGTSGTKTLSRGLRATSSTGGETGGEPATEVRGRSVLEPLEVAAGPGGADPP